MAGPESVKEASLKAYAQGFDTDRPELVADPSLPSPNPHPNPNPDPDPRPDPNPNPNPDPDEVLGLHGAGRAGREGGAGHAGREGGAGHAGRAAAVSTCAVVRARVRVRVRVRSWG